MKAKEALKLAGVSAIFYKSELADMAGSFSSRQFSVTEEYKIIEQDLTEHEQLKADVQRYLELTPEPNYRPLQQEVYELHEKLSKVGKL